MQPATEIKRAARQGGVVSCVVGVAFPGQVHAVSKLVFPLYFGEFIVVLWLALIGAKPRTAEA